MPRKRSERAEAAEKAVAELRDSVQTQRRTSSGGLTPAELAAVQKRIAALEQSVQGPRATEIAQECDNRQGGAAGAERRGLA